MGELERHGLVRASPDGKSFDFAHDLLRAGAYQKLSEPSRRVVHRTIARALGSNGIEPARANEVAHHATLGGDAELAVRAALAAAQRCLRMFAKEEAVRLADMGLAQLSALPREESMRKKIDLLAVYAYSGAEAARTPQIQTELSRAVLDAVDAGLMVEAAAGFHALSVLQFDSGDLGAAHQSTLRALSVVGEAVPSKRADQLGATARCLAMLERDLDDASAMYLEARAIADSARIATVAIECAGGYLAAHVGQVVEARAMFERGLELARAREDRWSEFETLRALTQLELDAGLQAAALARSADLLEVAARMGDGSELAVARALDCLGRFSRNDEGAEGLFDDALAALRGADVKGVLAYVLALAAEHDLRNERIDVAEERATEALRAADAVSRRSQSALARSILARVALARGDVAGATLRVESVLPETEQQKLSARARTTLAELAGALAEARADLHRSPGAAS